MEKVTVSKEVAEAIEIMRREGVGNFDIIRKAYNALITGPDIVLQRWAFEEEGGTVDELMRALVIGYQVEQTPEEKLREYYEGSVNNYAKFSEDVDREYFRGNRDGVKDSLNILGITIEGIND